MGSSGEDIRDRIIELLPRLRRFARALARNTHDADDLVQVALERALTRSAQLHAGAPLAPWMFGIVRNAWTDELRSRGRRARLFAPAEAGEQAVDASAGPHTEVLAVQEALARLLIEGLSYKEAAYIMDVPVGTLTSRLARGREALQAMLDETTGAQR